MFRVLLFSAIVALSPALAPAVSAADEVVRYQLTEWKAKHIHDEKKADTIAKTLKKLGCELKREEHSGHIDVKYRCPKWHELKLDTHDEAHKWETWLKEYGFKTEHQH
ncbi:hypothetical protein [Novipirellula artificiosorum]|uniref:Uncharacterized protein n=1 Tax=Novipirellula artificiosorum TaxID=2528016 RepID=A0A5C6DSD9_9BACT|nr:hypothetical protein [Novipirellula artificiosorum]TWU39640.1 hypothetical protein Poly41_24960 [Novipirellula artificiosorum]